MPENDFPTVIIRDARDDDYENIGRLHYAAFDPDPMIKLVWSQVDPDVALQWIWIDGAKAQVETAGEKVVVLERTDTKEVVGACWYRKYSSVKPPQYPDSLPKGLNVAEFDKMEKRVVLWLQTLVEQYGEFICECLSLVSLEQS